MHVKDTFTILIVPRTSLGRNDITVIGLQYIAIGFRNVHDAAEIQSGISEILGNLWIFKIDRHPGNTSYASENRI